ncbi:MAG: helix-turn-helix transcriptional regulator [Desulfitobacteriia bacterium]|jgi:AraC family transcriptional regulator
MGFMEQLLVHIPPHPLKDKVEAFPGNDMVIFKPSIIFEGPFCSHHYQFVLPWSDVPALTIEKQCFPVEPNKLLPINPEQVHGALARREVQGYLTILIKREIIREMAKSAFGKPDISFKNAFATVDSEARHLINQFMLETANRQLGFEFVQQGITLQLAINFLRRLKSNLCLEKSERSRPQENINKAIEFLNECYNEDFSLEDIARVANLSPYHFIRVFKAETGMTPHEYMMDIRIKRIKEMLADKNLSISQAFSYCGMDYNGHFAAVFKRKEGVTPSQYRKSVFG